MLTQSVLLLAAAMFMHVLKCCRLLQSRKRSNRCRSALQEHGQAVDPNLVQLAAAYREAKAQLGDDAVLPADGDSADEENMSANANGIPGRR